MRRNTDKSKANPDLNYIIDSLKKEIEKTINCVQIGIIQSYDAAEQTATIKIALKQVRQINDDGSKELVEHSLLVRCPVFTLHGGNGFISMPIQSGDNCIVLFNDRDIDNWFFDGGVNSPNSPRTHDLSDAIAIVGIKNLSNAISGIITNGIRINYNGTIIDILDDKVDIIADILETSNQAIVNGGLLVGGIIQSIGGTPLTIEADIDHTGDFVNTGSISAGNGASGTFTSVTVVNGIVTSGS